MLTEKLSHKKYVHGLCVEMLEARISSCRIAIGNAQRASNEEEKSSAGDKFETSRAMNHLEIEMFGKQLQSNLTELAALQSINLETLHAAITPGSYIVCQSFDVFIAAGLGKTKINDRTLYLISQEAPLYNLLRNKIPGDMFNLNNTEVEIFEIF